MTVRGYLFDVLICSDLVIFTPALLRVQPCSQPRWRSRGCQCCPNRALQKEPLSSGRRRNSDMLRGFSMWLLVHVTLWPSVKLYAPFTHRNVKHLQRNFIKYTNELNILSSLICHVCHTLHTAFTPDWFGKINYCLGVHCVWLFVKIMFKMLYLDRRNMNKHSVQ